MIYINVSLNTIENHARYSKGDVFLLDCIFVLNVIRTKSMQKSEGAKR